MAVAERDLISLDEVAARLGGISVKTVKRRIAEAGIRGPRPGREMMLTEGDYDRLVEATRERSPLPPTNVSRSARDALGSAHRRRTKRMLKNLRNLARQSG